MFAPPRIGLRLHRTRATRNAFLIYMSALLHRVILAYCLQSREALTPEQLSPESPASSSAPASIPCGMSGGKAVPSTPAPVRHTVTEYSIAPCTSHRRIDWRWLSPKPTSSSGVPFECAHPASTHAQEAAATGPSPLEHYLLDAANIVAPKQYGKHV